MALYYRRMRKQSIPNFVLKAWEMLEDERNWSCVCWNAGGSAFEVINEAQFCSELLPRYFRHSNLSSFMRQLNMYNFHKRRTPANTTEFHHTLFRRNHRELLVGIKRKPSEAEMQAAEELVQRLAPQCLTQTEPESEKLPAIAEETNENHSLGELQVGFYPDIGQLYILAPLAGNAFQGYQWKPEAKIRTNIIIQSFGAENSENMQWIGLGY